MESDAHGLRSEEVERLISDYLDGDLDEAGRQSLLAQLEQNPEALPAFDEALEIEALLRAAHTSPVADASPAPGRRVFPFPTPVLRWAAAAAAVVLLACGAWVFWDLRPGAGFHRLLDGQILVNGAPATTVPERAEIRVLGSVPAVIRLADRSRVELHPGSAIVLRGCSDETRQTVNLVGGKGRFTARKGAECFRVATVVGTVTVMGTEFSVSLHPVERPGGSGSPVARKGSKAMSVSVVSGRVKVRFRGQDHILAEGQEKTFTADEEPEHSHGERAVGRVLRIEDRRLTILTQGGDRDTGREQAFDLDANVSILLENPDSTSGEKREDHGIRRPKTIPGALNDLREGQTAVVTHRGGVATEVRVGKPPQSKSSEGKPGREKGNDSPSPTHLAPGRPD